MILETKYEEICGNWLCTLKEDGEVDILFTEESFARIWNVMLSLLAQRAQEKEYQSFLVRQSRSQYALRKQPAPCGH